ncbi:MAG: hypothetical protein K6G16_03870 [Lachnospiraceae bacterium]|nr:hypothetical protein [Lachnospiraceae bacterium]
MRKILPLCKCILFFVLVAGVLVVAFRVTGRKESIRKYADLHDASNADVLFLGSSHVINAVNPVQLYEDFGIASFNLGGHGSILPASYYELLCALDHFDPQLVVVDGYMMERDYHYVDEMTEAYTDSERAAAVSQLHLNLDIFPLSRTKIHAVRDLIADRSKQAEFFFPFILYHNRWSSLTGDDLISPDRSPLSNRLLGAEIRTGLDYRIAPHTMGDEEQDPDTVHTGEQYLQMILAACRERNIDVVLTFLPCNSTAEDRQTAARLEAVGAAEQIPCLNLLNEEIVDLRTDFSDEGHLNLRGMTAVTDRIGRFLNENLALPDRREDPAYRLWADRAEQYDKTLDDMLLQANTLSEALLMLSSGRTTRNAVLYLSGTGAAIGDPAVKNLLDAQLPGNVLRAATEKEEPAVFVLPANGTPSAITGYQVTGWEETSLGELETIQVENFTGLYLDHNESDNLLDMEDNRLADAQLVLFSGDGTIEKRLIFYYGNSSS